VLSRAAASGCRAPRPCFKSSCCDSHGPLPFRFLLYALMTFLIAAIYTTSGFGSLLRFV
jgi:hypothetical protein